MNTDNAVICSVHFADTDYKDDMKSRLVGIDTPKRQRTLNDGPVWSILFTILFSYAVSILILTNIVILAILM